MNKFARLGVWVVAAVAAAFPAAPPAQAKVHYDRLKLYLELQAARPDEPATVFSVAIAPNDSLVAGGSWKVIELWSTATGAVVGTLSGHLAWVSAIAFSPDSKTLVSGGQDTKIGLWDIATQKVKKVLSGHTGAVLSVVYSPDGKVIASSSLDKTVKLWDAESGALLRTLTGFKLPVRRLYFSNDGATLTTFGAVVPPFDGDIPNGTGDGLLSGPGVGGFMGGGGEDLPPDQKSKGELLMWNAKTGEQRTSPHVPVFAVSSFAPRHQWLVTKDTGLVIRDLSSTSSKVTELPRSRGDVTIDNLLFSPDESTLLYRQETGAMGLYDGVNPPITLPWNSDDTQVAVAFSPDGTIIAATTVEFGVSLWRAPAD
jgi:WD40 repeat protein